MVRVAGPSPDKSHVKWQALFAGPDEKLLKAVVDLVVEFPELCHAEHHDIFQWANAYIDAWEAVWENHHEQNKATTP